MYIVGTYSAGRQGRASQKKKYYMQYASSYSTLWGDDVLGDLGLKILRGVGHAFPSLL